MRGCADSANSADSTNSFDSFDSARAKETAVVESQSDLWFKCLQAIDSSQPGALIFDSLGF